MAVSSQPTQFSTPVRYESRKVNEGQTLNRFLADSYDAGNSDNNVQPELAANMQDHKTHEKAMINRLKRALRAK